MRKIFSLGLLAIIFLTLSGQLFAGKNEQCESNKAELQSKGLYGLCNAYWNNEGNETAQAAIIANILVKGGQAGLDLIEGKDTDFSCPCWDDVSDQQVGSVYIDGKWELMSVSTCDVKSTNEFDKISFVKFKAGFGVYLQGFGAGLTDDILGCGYFFSGGGVSEEDIREPISKSQVDACREELEAIALLYPEDCLN